MILVSVDRLENAIKSLGDNHRRLSSDIKTNHSTMTDTAVARIDRAVKSEMKRTILPGKEKLHQCIILVSFVYRHC